MITLNKNPVWRYFVFSPTFLVSKGFFIPDVTCSWGIAFFTAVDVNTKELTWRATD